MSKAPANDNRPSRVKHPVAYVRNYLEKNPDLGRAEAVQALVRRGVNRATARTQFQVCQVRRRG